MDELRESEFSSSPSTNNGEKKLKMSDLDTLRVVTFIPPASASIFDALIRN